MGLSFLFLFFFSAVLGLRGYSGFFFVLVSGGLLCSCGVWASHCGGFSRYRAQALGNVGSLTVLIVLYSTGSTAVAHRLSCSVACGIFPDQGSNLCLLH